MRKAAVSCFLFAFLSFICFLDLANVPSHGKDLGSRWIRAPVERPHKTTSIDSHQFTITSTTVTITNTIASDLLLIPLCHVYPLQMPNKILLLHIMRISLTLATFQGIVKPFLGYSTICQQYRQSYQSVWYFSWLVWYLERLSGRPIVETCTSRLPEIGWRRGVGDTGSPGSLNQQFTAQSRCKVLVDCLFFFRL